MVPLFYMLFGGAGWKGNLLNKAGRACLARSVTTAIPVYTMQTHYLPQNVCDEIDKITKSFIWGGDGVSRKWNRVKWNTVTTPKKFGGLSIHDSRLTNISLLGKLLWSILHEDHKFWVRVLSHKYIHGTSIWSAPHITNASVTWKGVIKAVEALKEGFKFRIGDGSSSLWYTDWTGDGLPCLSVDFVNISDTNLQLRDVCHDGAWGFDRLMTMLPQNLLNNFTRHPPPTYLHDDIPDKWVWEGSTTGTYSCASAYQWLVARHRDWDPNVRWTWIWKIGAPAKIQHLVWLCMHGALPTNKLRHHCNLAPSPLCQRCSSNVEDAIHCLRDCPYSREVWLRIGLLPSSGFLTCSDAPTWIQGMACGPHSTLFVATLWWVWCWRNNMVLGDGTWSVNKVIRSIHLSHDEFVIHFPPKHADGQAARILARWKAPPQGGVKLNVDGSCRESSGIIGSGGLLRDSTGNWIAGFHSNDGVGVPLQAELYGILHGLTMAVELGFLNCMCETDSLEAVTLINNGSAHEFSLHAGLLHQIKEVMDKMAGISIRHVYREANSCADFLAKEGASSSFGNKVLATPLSGLGSLLLRDALSI